MITIVLSFPPAVTATRAQAPLDPTVTKFGIIYGVWHCLAVNRTKGKPWNIAQALAGKQPWGPPSPAFHFWQEPQDGYYCLSDRPDVLQKHAKELRESGIDFVIIDASNNEYYDKRTPDSEVGINQPYKRLIEEWSKIPDAPKVVPFVPLTRSGNMLEYMMKFIDTNPSLAFIYEGKPLVIATTDRDRFTLDVAKERILSAKYTIRHMWAHQRQRSNVDRSEWSFMEICDRGFLASQGRAKCGQRKSIRGGKVEQIPIVTAYQLTYMSYKPTAVPKFHGRTFVQQFETLYEAQKTQNVPIAVIGGWNEWMAQRICVTPTLQPKAENCTLDDDHFPDGTKVFTDLYDIEYNRDIEPAKIPNGDFYYRLMKVCIEKYRAGQMCKTSDALSNARP